MTEPSLEHISRHTEEVRSTIAMKANTQHMTLTLEVIRLAGETPDQSMTASFGEQGGTIGRRDENDWILPDPERIISGQHALISFSNGQFYITDLSSNGVFLNRADAPLGKQARAPLSDGDRLSIGEYEIGVSLQMPTSHTAGTVGFDSLDDPFARLLNENAGVGLDQNTLSHNDAGIAPETEDHYSLDEHVPLDLDGPETPQATWPGNGASQSDHVSELNAYYQQPGMIPEDWLAELDGPGPAPHTPTPYDHPMAPADSPLEATYPRGLGGVNSLSPPNEAPNTYPNPSPQGTEPQPAASPTPPRQEALRTALARGLGVSGNQLDEIPLEELLENLGRIVRSSVEGAMSVLRARAQMKSEFRMSQTMIRPVENNPLKFSVNTEEALRHIIAPRPGNGYLSPLAAFREAHEDTEAHMLAVMVGMQSALKAVLQRFKPESLELRLGQSALLEKVPLYRRAKSWELFNELYGEIANEAEDDFHQLFGRTFSQAYEAQIRRLAALKQTNSGSTTRDPGQGR